MALKVTFSGPSPATNALSPGGAGTYFGSAPDFVAVLAALDNNGNYILSVFNYGGVPGWPLTFQMPKADPNGTNVIGRYEYNGGVGVAVVAP
ncbi:MAG: hypothetical protein AAF750_18860 [Planctomycetota bacterium]